MIHKTDQSATLPGQRGLSALQSKAQGMERRNLPCGCEASIRPKLATEHTNAMTADINVKALKRAENRVGVL